MLLQVAGIDAEQMAKELHAVVEPMQRYDIYSLTIYYDLSYLPEGDNAKYIS